MEDRKKSCPITEIKIVPVEEEKLYSNAIWTKDWLIKPDVVFLYSKQSDARPIIATKVETQPCLQPDQTSIDQN